jgi:hypothetical protein
VRSCLKAKIKPKAKTMHSSICIKETEVIIKYLSTKKTSGHDGVTGEFYQILKEEKSILHNLGNEKRIGEYSNSFYGPNQKHYKKFIVQCLL